MAEILIENGNIVNEGENFVGYIFVKADRISDIGKGSVPDYINEQFRGERIDARGKLVIPGVIDDQVHFREPGLTYKGDIHSESIAAVAGGITSFMDMPNTKPPTIDKFNLEQKFELAAESSIANYSFYFGATNENLREVINIDQDTVCGIKLFMGSSTGNMLVDDKKSLSGIFAESPVLIATHCEYEPIIRENSEKYRAKYGENIKPEMHPMIRSAEACYRSSAQAVELADKYGSDLHVLHVSTAQELALFDNKPLREKKITSEACVHHLWFTDQDYATKGNFIKWNPAIKTIKDRESLREGVSNGKIDVVATDHAPHTLEEKERPYWDCPSGGPMVQQSLTAMLELCNKGIFKIEQVVKKMCHAPAARFKIKERGFLRKGHYADIVIIENNPWTVSENNILYKCAWSPMLGEKFGYKVRHTIINGRIVYDGNTVDSSFRGMALKFDR